MKTFEHYRKSEIFAMLLMWMITIGVGIYIAVMYHKIPLWLLGTTRQLGKQNKSFIPLWSECADGYD